MTSIEDYLFKQFKKRQSLFHPLVEKKLDISVRDAYVGGLILVLNQLDDSVKAKTETYIKQLASELHLETSSVPDFMEVLDFCRSKSTIANCIQDMSDCLKGRDVALCFLCDVAKLLGMKGKFSS